jgi:carboxyl-terminal processing protease
MSLSLEGIGAVLQTENEYTMVRRIVTGGPADASSALDPGDRIVGVGQGTDQPIVDVIGWRLDDVVDLIRGPKGSVVRLEVLPRLAGSDSGTRVINLIRDRIKLEDQAAQKSVIEIPNHGETYRVGVIELPTFYIDFDGRAQGDPDFRSTTRDVRRLIEELTTDGIDGLIMDLRGNGGGALSEATSLTGLFIESGPIVQVRDQRGRVRINTDPDPDIAYDGPLVVLVDRNSASASEIFAAAIQDYKRGLIVGEPTFGKGTVQNLIDLDSYSSDRDEPLGQLKVTIAEFFRINGDSTQHRGVVPDVSIPIGGSSDKEGERAFSNALPWSYIEQTEHELFGSSWNEIALEAVMNEHSHRIESDPGLVYLITNAAMNEQIAEQTSISLLESKRRAERGQREQARLDAENALRRARGLSPLDALPQAEEEEIVVEDEGEENAFPGDILLDEAGRILADYLDRAGGPRVTLAPSTDDDTAMTTAPAGATISK